MGSGSSRLNRRRDGSTSVQILNRGAPQNLAQVGPSSTQSVIGSGQNPAGRNIPNTARHATAQGAPQNLAQIGPSSAPSVTASGQNPAGRNIPNNARHATEQGQANRIMGQNNQDSLANNLPGAVSRDLSSVSLRSGSLPPPSLL